MAGGVAVLLGTKKGAFILAGDADRENWALRGPFCETWPVRHFAWDADQRALLAGTANAWYGASVWRSTDMGETWTQSSEGLTYGEDGPKIPAVWNLTAGPRHASTRASSRQASSAATTAARRGRTWKG